MSAGALVARVGLALAVVSSGLAGRSLDQMAEARPAEEELLYLPNGRHLRLISLGFENLLADWVYLWSIQYYSNYEREDRYRYVSHVFEDVITELDPHYIDPYWLGALILTTEASDLDGGLRLLEKGYRSNPEKWILLYLAAWECYHAGRYEQAATYFERAAAVPGAPPVVLRMRAGMFEKSGDLGAAVRQWQAVLDDPRADSASVAIAERQIRDLRMKIDLGDLERAIGRFRNDNGRLPRRLSELTRAGYIRFAPRDPAGRPYAYDPATGRVGAPAARVLRES